MKGFLFICLSALAVLMGAAGLIALIVGAVIDGPVMIRVAGVIAMIVGFILFVFVAPHWETEEHRQWRERLEA